MEKETEEEMERWRSGKKEMTWSNGDWCRNGSMGGSRDGVLEREMDRWEEGRWKEI